MDTEYDTPINIKKLELENVAKNIMDICIIPNCHSYNIPIKELLNYMLKMDYLELDEPALMKIKFKIKKKRGRPRNSNTLKT